VTHVRPKILLVFLTRFEESTAMLKGIAHYERSHRSWEAFLDDEARAETDARWLLSKKWDGVISRHTTPHFASLCVKRRIPLVDLNDTPPHHGVPKIRPDNVGVGHLGAEHFLERGFRHFAFCGFSNDSWACERRDGFVEALALTGQRCEVHDVKYPGDLTPGWDARQIAALARWLSSLPKPVAVMCCNDLRALEVLEAAQDARQLVPEEVAILGANNDTIRCELASPPLSSVMTNPFQSGYHAAETLDLLMAKKRPASIDLRIDPIEVVTRHSTDVLAIHDRNVAAALSYIREHACEGVTVDEVVRHAAAARSQIERKFRYYLGRSPQAEIRRVQLARIRQLLHETNFPLKKIAELSGFEHVEYMCVLFKRLAGETPGAYRQRTQAPTRRAAGERVRPHK
jgi:LacI family transcriptional regulator